MTEVLIVIPDINPEPWKAPTFVGGGKFGKTRAVKDGALDAYQSAIQDHLFREYPLLTPMEGPLAIDMFFWRQKIGRDNIADATNLGKALEDALQGFPYKNDRANHRVQSWIVEQDKNTRPFIIVRVQPIEVLPEWVRSVFIGYVPALAKGAQRQDDTLTSLDALLDSWAPEIQE